MTRARPGGREEIFSLEEILAEYGSQRDTVIPEAMASPPDPPEKKKQGSGGKKRLFRPKLQPKPEPSPAPEAEPEPELPPAPRPIPMEEVVSRTVDAVMEEQAEETLLRPRRRLFSRRKMEDTEELHTAPEPEPEPEPEETTGPEPEMLDAADRFQAEWRKRRAPLLTALLVTLLPTVLLIAESAGA